MKGLIFKAITAVVLVFTVFGTFILFKGGGEGNMLTGAAVKDITGAVKNTTDTIKEIDQKTGITDTIKEKANEILGNTDTKKLIQQIIDLRKLSKNNNMVEIASKVTEMNKEIESIKNPSINTNWQVIVSCIYEKCSDDKFFSLIDAASIRDLKGTNEVIHSIVETYNFWDGKNVLQFSQSLSSTNNLIKGLNNKKISAAWDDVVKCNAKCDGFTDKLFDLIEYINNK